MTFTAAELKFFKEMENEAAKEDFIRFVEEQEALYKEEQEEKLLKEEK